VEKHVEHVLEIVGRVMYHRLRWSVGMGHVTVEKAVHPVLEIVGRVTCHHLRWYVEMACVMRGLERIVKHALGIALGPIRATTVLRPTGKPLHGSNAGHPVEIQQHGFQNIVKVVVVLYKISQCLLHIIMV